MRKIILSFSVAWLFSMGTAHAQSTLNNSPVDRLENERQQELIRKRATDAKPGASTELLPLRATEPA